MSTLVQTSRGAFILGNWEWRVGNWEWRIENGEPLACWGSTEAIESWEWRMMGRVWCVVIFCVILWGYYIIAILLLFYCELFGVNYCYINNLMYLCITFRKHIQAQVILKSLNKNNRAFHFYYKKQNLLRFEGLS